jgi:fatty-acyl-CoA synthase
MDISRWVRHRADSSPDRVAVHVGGADITYAALDRRVARLASALAGGLQIRPGDRVAYLGYNSPVVLDSPPAPVSAPSSLELALTASEHLVLGDAEPSALRRARCPRGGARGVSHLVACGRRPHAIAGTVT